MDGQYVENEARKTKTAATLCGVKRPAGKIRRLASHLRRPFFRPFAREGGQGCRYSLPSWGQVDMGSTRLEQSY
jgi:hypothetical protein